MTEIFLELLNKSIAASWLMLAIITLRLFLKKAPSWLFCMLWLMLAIRLIFPDFVESSLSLIPRAEVFHSDGIVDVQNTMIGNKPTVIHNIQYPAVDGMAVPKGQTNSLHMWLEWAAIAWIAGMIVFIVYALLKLWRIYSPLQEAVPLHDSIWICDAVHSPFILGLIKPRIYLSSSMEKDQIPYVLAHEQAHLQRKDHWWKLLGYLILIVYWFHPLVWISYKLFCTDLELACDEKVIRNMNIEDKKAYSHALVACSAHNKRIMAYPLSFGEIGIKQRVRAVLQYKKPAFWMIVVAAIVCVIVGVCFLTNPPQDAFDIKIVIPAESKDAIYYSEMEISPNKNSIHLLSGQELGDVEVLLQPIEVKEEDAYNEPIYLTSGSSTKVDVEKGAWFRIGVVLNNPTSQDRVIYIRVEQVTVRIASRNEEESIQYDLIPMVKVDGQYYYDTNTESIRQNRSADVDGEITSTVDSSEIPQENNESNFGIGYKYQYLNEKSIEIYINEGWWIFERRDNEDGTLQYSNLSIDSEDHKEQNVIDIEEAIRIAILENNTSSYPKEYDFACCDFVVLETLSATPLAGDTSHTITYYGWAMYKNYNISPEGIEDVGGSHLPVALTFILNENGYQLQEYWKPREGSYFVSDVHDKFPEHIVADGVDSQKFGVQQIQNCYRQAIQSSGLDTEYVIEKLVDRLCSKSNPFSNPQKYIEEQPIVYRELIYYGEYTLAYCIGRFEQGKETGLDGKVMAILCEELLQTQGKIPVDAATAETGQFWYDTLKAHASNRIESYLK